MSTSPHDHTCTEGKTGGDYLTSAIEELYHSLFGHPRAVVPATVEVQAQNTPQVVSHATGVSYHLSS